MPASRWLLAGWLLACLGCRSNDVAFLADVGHVESLCRPLVEGLMDDWSSAPAAEAYMARDDVLALQVGAREGIDALTADSQIHAPSEKAIAYFAAVRRFCDLGLDPSRLSQFALRQSLTDSQGNLTLARTIATAGVGELPPSDLLPITLKARKEVCAKAAQPGLCTFGAITGLGLPKASRALFRADPEAFFKEQPNLPLPPEITQAFAQAAKQKADHEAELTAAPAAQAAPTDPAGTAKRDEQERVAQMAEAARVYELARIRADEQKVSKAALAGYRICAATTKAEEPLRGYRAKALGQRFMGAMGPMMAKARNLAQNHPTPAVTSTLKASEAVFQFCKALAEGRTTGDLRHQAVEAQKLLTAVSVRG